MGGGGEEKSEKNKNGRKIGKGSEEKKWQKGRETATILKQRGGEHTVKFNEAIHGRPIRVNYGAVH